MIDCIFCKIIKGEIPSKIIYQDKDLVVFYDIHPKAPIHILIVPKKHLESLAVVSEQDKDLLGKMMLIVRKVADKLQLSKSGFKIVINNGKGSGQLVFHLHLHLIGGWEEKPHWQV